MHIYKPQYKSADGQYKECRNYACKFVIDGKQVVKSLQTPNKASALSKAKRIYARAKDEGWDELKPKLPGSRKTKISDVVELYKEYAKYTGLQKSTYTLNFKQLERIARELDVTAVENLDLKKWKRDNKGKISDVTLSMILRSAQGVFSSNAMLYYRDADKGWPSPFNGLKIEKPESKPFSGIPYEEIAKLVKDAKDELKPQDEPVYALFVLALAGGLRVGEAVFAKFKDLIGPRFSYQFK